MTTVVPIGYITILEAAEKLLPAMYAGVPDLPIVTSLRKKGIDVKDGAAMDRAIAELWKAVDEDSLRPMAIGGQPRRIERLALRGDEELGPVSATAECTLENHDKPITVFDLAGVPPEVIDLVVGLKIEEDLIEYFGIESPRLSAGAVCRRQDES